MSGTTHKDSSPLTFQTQILQWQAQMFTDPRYLKFLRISVFL